MRNQGNSIHSTHMPDLPPGHGRLQLGKLGFRKLEGPTARLYPTDQGRTGRAISTLALSILLLLLLLLYWLQWRRPQIPIIPLLQPRVSPRLWLYTYCRQTSSWDVRALSPLGVWRTTAIASLDSDDTRTSDLTLFSYRMRAQLL